MAAFQDPNQLSAFMKAYHLRGVPNPDLEDWTPAGLDALATLIAPHNEDRVALGLAKDASGLTHLYIASNREADPKTETHMEALWRQLVLIRTAMYEETGGLAIRTSLHDHPLQFDACVVGASVSDHLQRLQSLLCQFSVDRIRAYLQKDRNRRYQQFEYLVSSLSHAPSPADLAQLDLQERESLKLLQESELVQKHFPPMAQAIARLMEATSAPTETKAIFKELVTITKGYRKLRPEKRLFDDFFLAYFLRIRPMHIYPLNLFKWLAKVTFVSTQYQILIRAITDTDFATWISNELRIHWVPSLETRNVTLAEETIRDMLVASGFKQESLSYEGYVEFLSSRRHLPETRVHSECALLWYMHQQGISGAPMIGASRPLCILCSLFVQFYSAHFRCIVHTRSTDNKASAWLWPVIPDEDASFKSTFCKRLARFIQNSLYHKSFEKMLLEEESDRDFELQLNLLDEPDFF